MSGISSAELQMRVQSLKRAPPPKAPGSNENNACQDPQAAIAAGIQSFKLKKTGMRKSLIEADFPGIKDASHGDLPNELGSILAQRKARFEHPKEEPNEPPKRPLKPLVKPKPDPKPVEDNKEKTEVKPVEDETVEDVNGNRPISTTSGKLKPLPLLQKLGPAPSKPPMPGHLKDLLAKYSERDIVKYPRPISSVVPGQGENGVGDDNEGVDEEQDEELYDDLMDMQPESPKEAPAVNGTSEETSPAPDEGIMEENYDDIEAVAEQAKKINEGLEIKEESGSSSEADQGGGEDMYELIGQNMIQPPPTPSRPPSTPVSPKKKSEKKDKKELEQQKKKERDELKKKKKDEEMREKKAKDRDEKLRRKHKLKAAGNEEVTGTAFVTQDSKNEGKLDLPVRQGEVMFFLNSAENPPTGKWLAKNEKGHIGYVSTDIVSFAVDEDLYEPLDGIKETVNNLSAQISPPALPSPRISTHGSRKGAVTDEVYDDVQDGEGEDVYEAVGT